MMVQTLSVAGIPPHVDPALVIDFDFFADRRYAEAGNPFDGLQRLGAEVGHGIFWSPYNGGHWLITSRELLFEAAHMPSLFSSTNISFPALPPEQEPFYPPVSVDPPDHGFYRLPLMRAFSPTRARALGTEIRRFAAELVDKVARRGCCEFVDEIAEPLPISIFMQLMGFDLARYKEFRVWAGWLMQPDPDKRLQAYSNIIGMARALFEERRIAPKDDLLSTLLEARFDDRPFTQAELDGMCIQLFGAGLDTVVNSLSFGMEYLARNPTLQERLRAEPALIPDAVEEILRCFGVAFPMRSVKQDGQFHGATMKAGERVLMVLAAGNQDPQEKPDAARFDLDRADKFSLTFNTGPHRCVGSHLARLEMVTLFEEWLTRVPTIHLDPAQPPGYSTGVVFAVTRLTLRWDVSETG
jgi:cytochrome P450